MLRSSDRSADGQTTLGFDSKHLSCLISTSPCAAWKMGHKTKQDINRNKWTGQKVNHFQEFAVGIAELLTNMFSSSTKALRVQWQLETKETFNLVDAAKWIKRERESLTPVVFVGSSCNYHKSFRFPATRYPSSGARTHEHLSLYSISKNGPSARSLARSSQQTERTLTMRRRRIVIQPAQRKHQH